MRRLLHQLARFGAVGLVGLVVDVGVFNLLRATVLSPEETASGPFVAKVISTALAIAVNWIGNRYWTFRSQRQSSLVREGLQFAVVSVGGMLIALGCLWPSHYVLGFTSVIADNISSNVIGLGLGAAFRFWLYRVWVFRGVGSDSGVSASSTSETSWTSGVSASSTSGTGPASETSPAGVGALAARYGRPSAR